MTDHFYPRLLLALTMPLWICLGLFFVVVVFGNIFEVIGPVTGVKTNSRFHSAIKPSLTLARAQGFRPPPITIQMPIYTESLEGVVKPTVASLQAAISYYESRVSRIPSMPDGVRIHCVNLQDILNFKVGDSQNMDAFVRTACETSTDSTSRADLRVSS
jgi:hypothetical protein